MDPYGISESAMLEAAQLSAMETQEKWERAEQGGDNRVTNRGAGRRKSAEALGESEKSRELTATRLKNGKV